MGILAYKYDSDETSGHVVLVPGEPKTSEVYANRNSFFEEFDYFIKFYDVDPTKTELILFALLSLRS